MKVIGQIQKLGMWSLGLFWLWAGVSKWMQGFDAERFLQGVIHNPSTLETAIGRSLSMAINAVGLPYIQWVNITIPAIEVALGCWLLIGKNMRAALFVQALLCLVFVTCGAISTNPLLLLVTLGLYFSLSKNSVSTKNQPKLAMSPTFSTEI